MFCTKCGKPVGEDSDFCTHCGNKIDYKINEERKRHLINNILVQNDLKRRAIDRSTDKLLFEKYHNDIDNDYNDYNETRNFRNEKRGDIGKRNKNNGILINSHTPD